MEWMFMPLKRYAEFSGRSRRMEYWMFVLFQVLVYLALSVLMFVVTGTLFGVGGKDTVNPMAAGATAALFLLIIFFVWLALLVPSLAVAVRRLHDTNRSGWWFGGYFLAYIGFYAVGGTLLVSSMGSPGALVAVSGLMSIAGLAFLAYAIVLLVFFCLDGTPGPNQYGPDPKGVGTANVFS